VLLCKASAEILSSSATTGDASSVQRLRDVMPPIMVLKSASWEALDKFHGRTDLGGRLDLASFVSHSKICVL
jgi:hypothetical protein